MLATDKAVLVSHCNKKTLHACTQVAASHPSPSEGWDPSIQPPEILLGILSSDIRLAVRALRDWTSALHVPFVVPESRVMSVQLAHFEVLVQSSTSDCSVSVA